MTPPRPLSVRQARRLVCLVLLVTMPATAAPITWRRALELGREQAPAVTAARARVHSVQSGEAVAAVIPNPTVTVASYINSARLYTSIALPLPIWGQIGLATEAARARTTEATQLGQATALDAAGGAVSAWIDLWLADRLLEIARDNQQRAVRLEQSLAGLVSAGQRPQLDLVTVRAELAQVSALVGNLSHVVTAARRVLAARIGLTDEEELPTALGAAPQPQSRAPVDQEANVGSHPALRASAARIKSTEADTRLAKRLRIPTPTLLANAYLLRTTAPDADFFLGLGFELPVFNQRGAQVAQARALNSQAEADAAATEATLHAEARAAAERYAGAATLAEVQRTQVVPAIEQAAALAQEAYLSGRIDIIGLISAEQRLSDAQTRLRQAVAERARAYVALARATGRFP